MRVRHFLFAATMLAVAAPAAAGPTEDFKALADEFWAATMREFPTFASQLGIHDYDDRLTDISLAAEDRRAGAGAAYLKRLEAIADAGLTPADRINKAILRRSLSEAIEARSIKCSRPASSGGGDPAPGANGLRRGSMGRLCQVIRKL